jgi:hypothetical protein
MSRESHANHTTPRWASSSGYDSAFLVLAMKQRLTFCQCNWEIEDTSIPLKHPSSAPQSSAASVASAKSTNGNNKVKVSFLTEQTSHHPPVSAFYIDCPEKGIFARGYDHLSAKFTGTSIRVTAGSHNLGIFLTLQKWDNEQYQLTHPAAHLGGLLRGKGIHSETGSESKTNRP